VTCRVVLELLEPNLYHHNQCSIKAFELCADDSVDASEL